MDDPNIRAEAHTRALAGLVRLNRLSFASTPIARAIRRSIPPGDLTILDVACGSGDVTHAVYRKLQTRYKCQVILADISPHALQIARARFTDTPADTRCIDAIDDELPNADVVMCSLFLHHLTRHDCVRLLVSMSVAARKLVVISDMRRSRHGTLLAGVIPKLTTISPIVHTDALKSARAAFTLPEIRSIASEARLSGMVIRKIPPSRLLLVSETQK